MNLSQMNDCLERSPIIAAGRDDMWQAALASPAEVLFMLGANLLSVADRIAEAHEKGKYVLVHIDLAEGIGKDKTGIEYLRSVGADGIISTRAGIIRSAREAGLLTVQRFFALDSQGIGGIGDMLESSRADMLEIMPGVIGKVIAKFAGGRVPVIAGGLIEDKAEVPEALANGAVAVSTGSSSLWSL